MNKFISLIETLVLLRNTCAHGGVLLHLKIPKGISKIPEIEFNNNDRMSLDSSIKVVLYFLQKISNDRKCDLENSIIEIFEYFWYNGFVKRIIEGDINYIYK